MSYSDEFASSVVHVEVTQEELKLLNTTQEVGIIYF